MSFDMRDVRIDSFREPERRGGRHRAIHWPTGASVEWDDTKENSQDASALREAKLRELEALSMQDADTNPTDSPHDSAATNPQVIDK